MNSSRTSISTSVRRHFVDKFFFAQEDRFRSGIKVVDIGGKKEKKRGLFNIDKYGANVTYVNIDKTTNPDIVSDASNIPLLEKSFDIAVLGEILEHVPDPKAVLKETSRLLKDGGVALVTVPFMVGVHGDPYDYGRYTSTFLKEAGEEAGFSNINVEQQGSIFAVAALMLQHLFMAYKRSWRPIQNPIVSLLMWLDSKTTHPLLQAWTTGYGIILKK